MSTYTQRAEVPALIEAPNEASALEFFTGGEATALPLLEKVKAHIAAFSLETSADAQTEAGRTEIKRFVSRITRTRTTLESVGLEVARRQKEIPAKIDATRRILKTTLESWEAEVRKPVTDWEAAEKKRVELIKASLEELQGTISDTTERSSEVLRDRLGEVKRDAYTEAVFGEYLHAAIELRDTAIARLTDRIAIAEQRERDKAELEALRAERDKVEAAERDERIRQEGIRAAEAAAKAAAEKAVQDQLDAAAKREATAQREAAEAKERAEKAEREAAAAKARAAGTPMPAKAVDVSKLTDAQREAIGKVNRDARNALVVGGVDVATAQKVIELIARRKVPGVSIFYPEAS